MSRAAPVTGALTRSEREDLLRVARLRLKVAKTAASQRSAELIAEFERLLARWERGR